MSLPSNVSFAMQNLASYTRNTIRIECNAANSLSTQGNSMISATLPTNAVVNMKSFSMHCDASTQGVAAVAAGSNVYALLTSIPDALHRISWSAGGMALSNSTGDYNVINRMLQNVKTSQNKFMSDQRVCSQSALEPIVETDTYATQKYGQEKHLTCSQFQGFTQIMPCFVSTSILPELRFTAQMSSNTGFIPVQYQNTTLGQRTGQVDNTNWNNGAGKQPRYDMANIYFTIEIISVNGLLQELAQQHLMEAGSIRLPFKEYNIFSQSASGTSGSCRGSISTQSLDRVYSFMRSTDTSTAGPAHDRYDLPQPPVLVDGSSSYSCVPAAFNFTGHNVSTSKLKILNSPYPLFDPTIWDNFVALQVAEDRTYDGQAGGLIGSASQWQYNAWVNLVQLCHSTNVRLVSGLDLSSVNGSITSNIVADGGDDWSKLHQMICESTSVLTVGQSRAVAITS